MKNTISLAWRLANRERRSGIRGFGVFLSCLTLGVATIAAVGTVSDGIQTTLRDDGRLLLGGDIDLRSTHYPATKGQTQWIKTNAAKLSRIIQMRVMAKRQDNTRHLLAELKAVDRQYPLYGELRLKPANSLAVALSVRKGIHGVAVEQQLIEKLGVAVGDRIKVGQGQYEIRAAIEKEPDRSSQVFRLGPRILMSLTGVHATGLIQPGSLVRYHYRIALEDQARTQEWTRRLAETFPDAGWRVRTIDNAAPNIQRFTGRVTLFLTLVGLTTLLIGGVGISTGVTSFINGRLSTIATFKSLGASGGLVFTTYFFQILLIAGIGIVTGLVLGMLAPLLATPLLHEKLDITSQFGFYPTALLEAAAFGILITLVCSLWPLARARNVKASALFRAVVEPVRGLPSRGYMVALAILILTLAAFTIATTELQHIAIWFVGGAAAAFAVFRLAALAIEILFRRLPRPHNTTIRLAFANLHRPGAATTTVTLALGLGLTVLTAVVLMEENLARQVDHTIPKTAPAYYFIDIQPKQRLAFETLVKRQPSITRVAQVPVLRGRILKLAGVPAARIEAPPEVAWVLRGDRGLTWSREPPTEGSKVVEGVWWPKDYDGPPLVSFDQAKARAFGLKIGDTITINLLGRPLTARIANLRAIKWDSLSINFLMIFSPGAMKGAPLSYLATAHFEANASEKDERATARAVTDEFPNISAIRVKDVLSDVSKIVADIGIAVRASASVAIIAGILVLAGAIAASHRRRVYDAIVLKVLGATRRRLLMVFALEFGILGVTTAAIASLIGTIVAWAIVVHVMRAEWTFIPEAVFWTLGLSLFLTVASGFVGTWLALGQKPAKHLCNE